MADKEASGQSLPSEVLRRWRDYSNSRIARGDAIGECLQQYTTLEKAKVLDVGCGSGGVLEAFAKRGASLLGLDASLQRLRDAHLYLQRECPKSPIDVIQAIGEKISVKTSSIDIVVCNDVLEHVENQNAVIHEISRILKPGGWLYVQFPNRLSPANFRSDPHYCMFGISILPPRLGAWYVTSMRKRYQTYEVGRFPIASRVIHLLDCVGITLIDWWPAPHRSLGVLTPLLRLYRLNTHPLVTLVGQKR